MNTSPLAVLSSYQTSDGFEFTLLNFKNARATDTVAIYIHGNGSASITKNIQNTNILASTLSQDGIDLIVTNNRGSGYIEQNRRVTSNGAEKVFTGMTYETITDSQYDLAGMIEYAISEGYKKIYLVGLSTGANKIAVYNHYVKEKPEELKGYIFVSGGDDIGLRRKLLGDKLPESYVYIRQQVEAGKGGEFVDSTVYPTRHPLSYKSLFEMLEQGSDYDVFNFHSTNKDDSFRFLKEVTIPSLYVYGSDDDSTYIEAAAAVELLKSLLPSATNRFEVIKDADHNFKGVEQLLATTVSHWISEH